MNFEEERERIRLHRERALELIGKEEFPIYKVANTRFFEKDVAPQCLAGYDFYMKDKPVHGIPSTDPKGVFNKYFSEGKYLTDLADRQAVLSYPDSPCISWTLDTKVTDQYKNNDYFQEYGYILLESVGKLVNIPEKIEELLAIGFNEGFYIPALSKFTIVDRPQKEIEFQKEFVTFGVFPKGEYKVLEFIKK